MGDGHNLTHKISLLRPGSGRSGQGNNLLHIDVPCHPARRKNCAQRCLSESCRARTGPLAQFAQCCPCTSSWWPQGR
eukprot:189213-Amphidinium_carterae.1